MAIVFVQWVSRHISKALLITSCVASLSITINSQTPDPGCEPGKTIVSSSFNNEAEKWTLAGDGENLQVFSGYITGTDKGEGVGWYFKAPSKFLGDMSHAYGGSITFELNQIKNGSAEFQYSLVEIDDGETFLWYNPDPNPKANGWTPLTVCFKESKGWGVWKGEQFVREATSEDLKKVLSNLKQLLILPEHSSDRDVGGLRNVAMRLPANPDLRVAEFKADLQGKERQKYWKIKAKVENIGNGDLKNEYWVQLSYSNTLNPRSKDWKTVTKLGNAGSTLKRGESAIFEWRTDQKTEDGDFPKLPDSAVALQIEIDWYDEIRELSEENNTGVLFKICEQPKYQSEPDDRNTKQTQSNHTLEWGDSDQDKAMAVLCFIRAQAEQNAKIEKGSVDGSRFFTLLEEEYLKDYLSTPARASAKSVIDSIGAPLVFSTTLDLGLNTIEKMYSIPISDGFRRRYPTKIPSELIAPLGILAYTPFRTGHFPAPIPSFKKISSDGVVMDVPFLLGVPVGTPNMNDRFSGGKNWSNVMHWATGVKYHALPKQAIRELFVLYEYFHMEGFDVFGEDAINDLIAEEQGRSFGGLLSTGRLFTRKKVVAAMDRQFQESRAWVGAIVKYRQDQLDSAILSPDPPPSDFNFTGIFGYVWPWGNDDRSDQTIKQQIADGRSVSEVIASPLVGRLIKTYELIYETELWQKKNGRITLSRIVKHCVRGDYDRDWKVIKGDEKVFRAYWALKETGNFNW